MKELKKIKEKIRNKDFEFVKKNQTQNLKKLKDLISEVRRITEKEVSPA